MLNLPIFCHQDHHCFRLRDVDFLLPLLQIKLALSKMGLLFFTAFLALVELPHPWSWESSKVKPLFHLIHALVLYSVKSGVNLIVYCFEVFFLFLLLCILTTQSFEAHSENFQKFPNVRLYISSSFSSLKEAYQCKDLY